MPAEDLRRIGLGTVRAILARLDEISSRDFPSDAPERIAEALRKIVEQTAVALEQPDERIRKFACQLLREVSGHLRYIESASSAKVPAPLIVPFQTLLERLLPNARVMFRVQWSFNYSVLEFIEIYRSAFSSLLGSTIVDQILQDLSPLYVIGVPSVEHDNVLLHCILGHEFGHRLADDFLAQEDQPSLMASIQARIGDLTWYLPDFKSLPPLLQLPVKQRAFASLLLARKRALQELISDVAGYALFGAPTLFATEDIAVGGVLDATPNESSSYYPPWRTRLRELWKSAEADGLATRLTQLSGSDPIPIIRDRALARLNRLRTTVADSGDLAAINSDPTIRRAYEDQDQAILSARQFVATAIGGNKFTLPNSVGPIEDLLLRIAIGVPPDTSAGTVPDFRLVMLAGWLYRVAQLPVPFSARAWTPEDDEVLNRLVTKAVESVTLASQFATWNDSGRP